LSSPVMNLRPLRSFGKTFGKSGLSEDHVWSESKESLAKINRQIPGMPEFYRALSLNVAAQRMVLSQAPMEFTKAAKRTQVVMTLPMPDGSNTRFRVEESPVLSPTLAARFPTIKTYRGRGVDDPTAMTRFDVTPEGFHAIVISADGTVIIEPNAQRQARNYISYYQRDAAKGSNSSSCVLFGADQAAGQAPSRQLGRSSFANLSTSSGSTLRNYRTAVAATAEFTQVFGGGTVAGALSAITTLVNGVNAIYERDLGIHLTLVPNETSIIFTNTATDGYTSDDVTAMLAQNQVVLDQRIGSANYDAGMVLDGHVYNFQPGRFIFQGAAQYQSVCNSGQKGRAVSVLRSTAPSTILAVYVVAHEFGHLFGALHSFNGTLDDCGPSRFAQTAYEPGSGSTIMGYRGGVLPNGVYYPLCSTEELFSTDTYFHSASIEQINNYTSFSNGSFCPSVTTTDNGLPNVDAGPDYTIPANTPFTLRATGSDSDGDALSYCWEEYDLGAAGPPHTDNGNRPIFRSFAPVATVERTFPQISDILSGTPTFGESLPTTNRSMNFRVTVRDNRPGGVNASGTHVNIVAGSPFAVTQPGSATTWTAGSNQTVSWDVANTSSIPVNCANVRVLLSIDGGNSFPFTLAASTPNIGTATINVPNLTTSTARVKVEAIGNIFFNISLANFAITPNTSAPPTLLTEANSNRAIALDSLTFVRDPFGVTTPYNFGVDQRTRVMLFATGLELLAGENASVVTAQAEDSAQKIYPLAIEYVGKVRGFDWLTQVNVRLPAGLGSAGDLLITVSLRGAASNKVVVGTHSP
jgi:Metallo-peptidase family M12B Reprolysin-like